MAGFLYRGYPNTIDIDKALPRGVAWECTNLNGPDPIVRSGYADPRSLEASVRRRFKPDGTLVVVHDGYLLVAVPEDYSGFSPDHEYERVRDHGNIAIAGWNFAEQQCRAFLLNNLHRIPASAYRGGAC